MNRLKLYKMIVSITYNLVHMLLGLVSVLLGITLEAAIVFALYEVADFYMQLKVLELYTLADMKEYSAAWLEHVNDMYGEKRELRRDLGMFIIGLILGKTILGF